MDEFACWQVSDDELSPEVRAGLRRAFEIARDRHSASIEADDLVLGLLAMRTKLGIAWVGDWPVDVGSHIAGLPREGSATPPEPSLGARTMLQHALEQARAEGEAVVAWEYVVAACGEQPGRVVGEYYNGHQGPETWRATVASSRRAHDASSSTTTDHVLTLQQAATLLSMHVQTLREYIRQGRLRAYRIAGERAVRVLREDVMALLEPESTDASRSRESSRSTAQRRPPR